MTTAEMEAQIPGWMKAAEVPGLAVALIRENEIAWARGFGVCHVETREPVTQETIFQAASLSKPTFGYVALKLDCEPAPLILGFVLGPMMEENLRRALLISRGDPLVFVQEPISLAFLLVAAGLLIVLAAPAIRRKREEALKE